MGKGIDHNGVWRFKIYKEKDVYIVAGNLMDAFELWQKHPLFEVSECYEVKEFLEYVVTEDILTNYASDFVYPGVS